MPKRTLIRWARFLSGWDGDSAFNKIGGCNAAWNHLSSRRQPANGRTDDLSDAGKQMPKPKLRSGRRKKKARFFERKATGKKPQYWRGFAERDESCETANAQKLARSTIASGNSRAHLRDGPDANADDSGIPAGVGEEHNKALTNAIFFII